MHKKIMPVERYYIDCPLINGQKVKITGSEFHHLYHVMRSRIGDLVELVNGKGQLSKSQICELAKDHAIIQIESSIQTTEKKTKMILAQALPKQNRLDFILEKGTELGVDAFWLFPGDLSIKKELSENQIEKAYLQLIAALKQSGRLFLPEICLFSNLDQFPEIAGSAFFGDLDPKAPPLKDMLVNHKTVSPIIFFIGPESGFSPRELDQLHRLKVQGVKLNERILRTDTAALTAIALLSHLL